MMDNNHHIDGSWVGFGITFVLGIVAKYTLSDVALVSTILAGITSTGYTIYKWKKHK